MENKGSISGRILELLEGLTVNEAEQALEMAGHNMRATGRLSFRRQDAPAEPVPVTAESSPECENSIARRELP